MVYHNRTVKCPNCQKVAERTTTRDEEELYGSPFRVCPHCGKTYFDPDYHEKAITYFQDRGGEISVWFVIWFFISNAGAIWIAIKASKDGNMIAGPWILFFVLLVLALISDIGLIRFIYHRAKPDKYHQKQLDIIEGRAGERDSELVASMERLNNSNYLDNLKAHGVDVPAYFFERLK